MASVSALCLYAYTVLVHDQVNHFVSDFWCAKSEHRHRFSRCAETSRSCISSCNISWRHRNKLRIPTEYAMFHTLSCAAEGLLGKNSQTKTQSGTAIFLHQPSSQHEFPTDEMARLFGKRKITTTMVPETRHNETIDLRAREAVTQIPKSELTSVTLKGDVLLTLCVGEEGLYVYTACCESPPGS